MTAREIYYRILEVYANNPQISYIYVNEILFQTLKSLPDVHLTAWPDQLRMSMVSVRHFGHPRKGMTLYTVFFDEFPPNKVMARVELI